MIMMNLSAAQFPVAQWPCVAKGQNIDKQSRGGSRASTGTQWQIWSSLRLLRMHFELWDSQRDNPRDPKSAALVPPADWALCSQDHPAHLAQTCARDKHVNKYWMQPKKMHMQSNVCKHANKYKTRGWLGKYYLPLAPRSNTHINWLWPLSSDKKRTLLQSQKDLIGALINNADQNWFANPERFC